MCDVNALVWMGRGWYRSHALRSARDSRRPGAPCPRLLYPTGLIQTTQTNNCHQQGVIRHMSGDLAKVLGVSQSATGGGDGKGGKGDKGAGAGSIAGGDGSMRKQTQADDQVRAGRGGCAAVTFLYAPCRALSCRAASALPRSAHRPAPSLLPAPHTYCFTSAFCHLHTHTYTHATHAPRTPSLLN